MPTLNTKIWGALENGIKSLDMRQAGDPAFATAWPIAWPGPNFTPTAKRAWLAVNSIKAPPVRRVINRRVSDRNGTLTVTAVMPIGTYPTVVYEDFAGRIIAHFQGCLRYQDVLLTLMSPSGNTAYAPGGYRDGGFWREPVNIPWRTWA